MSTENETLWLHFKYCMFIAAVAIILIACEKWSSSKDFTTYLSNAATMTSLFLGIIAILYSFISNDSLSKGLGSISTVADQVKEVRLEISKFVDLTKSANETAATSSEHVQKASSSISSSLGTLDSTLRELSIQNETLRGLLGNLPTRFDQLEAKVGDVTKAIGEKPQQAQPPISTAEISTVAVSRFLARATLHQNLLAHACVLAAQSQKPLPIAAFCKAVELDAPLGLNGFLNCMNAIQLCWRKAIEGQDKVYTVSSVHPDLAGQSRSYYENYIGETYADRPDEKEKWLNRLHALEALFA